MGKNLTRLFKDRAVRNQAGIEAHNKLGWIWDRHGESLIAALEESLHCFQITQRVKDYPVDHWASKAQQLLAQLEAEAQP